MIKEKITNKFGTRKPFYFLSMCAMVLIGYYHIWPALIKWDQELLIDKNNWILAAIPYIAFAFGSLIVIYMVLAGNPIIFRSKIEFTLLALISPLVFFGLLGYADLIGVENTSIIFGLIFTIALVEKYYYKTIHNNNEEV